MSASIVVTLDIGGSAAKASAYDAAGRSSLGHAAAPYPAPAPGADPGTFDPQAWWRAAVVALRDLREQLGAPAARYLGITVSAIRIPFVLAGADGEPVMPGLLNSDRRAQPYVGQAAAALGADRLYELTGHWPARSSGCPSCCGRGPRTRRRGGRRGPCCSCTTGSSGGCPARGSASGPRRP